MTTHGYLPDHLRLCDVLLVSKPAAALLGALMAQIALGLQQFAGKIPCPVAFEDLDVPPTLVSFATVLRAHIRCCASEFKGGDRLVVIAPPTYETGLLPSFDISQDSLESWSRQPFPRAPPLPGLPFAHTPGYGGCRCFSRVAWATASALNLSRITCGR